MCGIIGYIGKRKTLPILMEGLRRMEYRGYDSAGIATIEQKSLAITKQAGNISTLEEVLEKENHAGTIGIGHIRWATHGIPNQINAHPHIDCTGTIAVVHNGIIENHDTLRKELRARGHAIVSETDTELIAHLIEEEIRTKKPIKEAVADALSHVEGTYGVAVLSASHPTTLVCARFGSPLILGIVRPGEYIIASDASAIISHTKEVIYLEENDIATLEESHYSIENQRRAINRKRHTIEWELEHIQKQNFPHFMLKEIYEQPESVRNATRGRVLADEGLVKLGGLEEAASQISRIERLVIIGCGSAWHAGLVGEYWIEALAGIPTEVEHASEFRYRSFPTNHARTACIVISQSGETADTIAALREAKRRGMLTIGIVNTVGSTIARETDVGMYNHAGPEIAVASTKAFLSQLVMLLLTSVALGRRTILSPSDSKDILQELLAIPEHINTILNQKEHIFSIAEKYTSAKHALYIGRLASYPIACEGALKLKEISYIHAEGYAAGEMKHGPIALVDPDMPTIAVAPKDSVFEKTLSNIQEIKARGGPVILVTDTDDEHAHATADDIIRIPAVHSLLTPLLSVIPLQMLAYRIAVVRGYNVDKPRNLAKSVTVE